MRLSGQNANFMLFMFNLLFSVIHQLEGITLLSLKTSYTDGFLI